MKSQDFFKEINIIVIILIITAYFISFQFIFNTASDSDENFNMILNILNIILAVILVLLIITLLFLIKNRLVIRNEINSFYDYFFNYMGMGYKYIIIDMMLNNGRKSYNSNFATYLKKLIKMGLIVQRKPINKLDKEIDHTLINVALSRYFLELAETKYFKKQFQIQYQNRETVEEVNDFILKVQSGIRNK